MPWLSQTVPFSKGVSLADGQKTSPPRLGIGAREAGVRDVMQSLVLARVLGLYDTEIYCGNQLMRSRSLRSPMN